MEATAHVGEKGWLFLEGGSNDPVSYHTGQAVFTIKDADSWTDLITSRHDRLSKMGIKYVHFTAPNKMSVYNEFFRRKDLISNQNPFSVWMNTLYQRKDKALLQIVINPLPYFNKHKDILDLYWKTDSHWNFYGCICGYQLICSTLGCKNNPDLINRKYHEGMTLMDLGGKLDPVLKEKGRFYNLISDSERIYCNELVQFKEDKNRLNDLHVGSNVVYRNPNALNDQKLVLFGDSFSEYRPHLLTGMLAESFREVHFVWSTSLDFSYIEKHHPDIVVSEIVERFMPRTPQDTFSLDEHVRKTLILEKIKSGKANFDRVINGKSV